MKFTNVDKGRLLFGLAIILLIAWALFPQVTCGTTQCIITMYITHLIFCIFVVLGLTFSVIIGCKSD